MSGDVIHIDESSQIAGFSPRTVHIKFKMDSLRYVGFPLSLYFHQCSVLIRVSTMSLSSSKWQLRHVTLKKKASYKNNLDTLKIVCLTAALFQPVVFAVLVFTLPSLEKWLYSLEFVRLALPAWITLLLNHAVRNFGCHANCRSLCVLSSCQPCGKLCFAFAVILKSATKFQARRA